MINLSHYYESVVVGEISYLYMKDTILKLGDMMTLACRSKSDAKHVSFAEDSLIYLLCLVIINFFLLVLFAMQPRFETSKAPN